MEILTKRLVNKWGAPTALSQLCRLAHVSNMELY